MPYTEIDYDTIKSRVSITDVLSRYTRVPSKARYRIPCPIHGGESWNSFSVNEDRGLFHCFSCGVAGDVITLLAKLDGISNNAAARRLAEEYDIDRTTEAPSFRAIVNEARNYVAPAPLPEVKLPPAVPLSGFRHFSRDAIRHFDLKLVPTGVLTPFKDMEGRAVGYSIRQTKLEPKYLNSRGLRKTEIVYGLYENRDAIANNLLTAIVCEGQFSAIRVWDAGYHNVVATLGATLSPTQAHILSGYAGRLIILYDGDEAGRIGAEKIKETYAAMFRITIKRLEEGTDPDTGDLTILGENNDRMDTPRTGEDVVR